MPRLWPLLVALPALVLWLAELSISASSQSAQAEQQAVAYAARAVDAVAVRVATRRAELQALTLRLSASPATWGTLEALRAGKSELAAERMLAVRRVAQDAVSTGLRGALILGVRADAGGSYVRGADIPGPGLAGVEVDVLAGAGSDGQTRDAFGAYDLFFSVPLTGSDKDAHALGTLVVGGPLLPDGTADQVALEMGLAAVGFVTAGKLVAAGGPDRGVLQAALRETPVGKHAAAVRGSAGALGPLRLPLWTSGGEPALRVAVRRSLPGQPVEVLAVANLEPFMSTLADTQRFALSCIAGLTVLLAAALAWSRRNAPARAPRPDEDTLPPPRRTTPPRPLALRPLEAVPPPAPVEVLAAPASPPAPQTPVPAAAPAASVFDAAPAALSGAVLDVEPPAAPLSRLPPPPPGEDLSALLDVLKIKKVAFAGHSMGGYVALAFARNFADRLSGLGLVATQALADTPEKKAGRYQEAEQLLAQGVSEVAESMSTRLTANSVLQTRLEKLILKQRPEGLAGALRAMAERPDSTGILSTFDFPVAIIHGLADQLIPVERARFIRDAVKQSTLVEIEGAGHMPMMEAPQATAEALKILL